MAAVALERSTRCHSCGTDEREWAEDPYAYEPVRHTCKGCMLREVMSEDDTPTSKGTTIRLVPKETAERMRLERDLRAAEGTLRPQRRRSRE